MDKKARRKELAEKRKMEGERCNLFGLRFIKKEVFLEAIGVDPEIDKLVSEELHVARYYYSEHHNEIVVRITLK